MAITASTRKQIIELVVTAYNAAPGTTLLNELVIMSNNGSSLADIAASLTTRTEWTSKYPVLQTAEDFTAEWLDNILPEASATLLAEATTLVVAAVNGGSTFASLIVDVSAFMAAASETDVTIGTSVGNFNNKVAVATNYTVTLEQAASSATVLNGVTSDDATVTSANAAADGTASTSTGSTFTLTTGIDSVTDSTNTVNAIIDQSGTAANNTWNLSDTIKTAAGGTLNLSLLSSLSIATAGFNTTNVTTLNLKSVDTVTTAAANSFDLSGLSGLTSLNIANSSVAGTTDDNLTINSLGSATAVSLTSNDSDQDITLSGSWSGAANVLNLTVTGTNGDVNLATGIETINVVGGAGGRLASLKSDTTDTVTSVVVTGESFRADSMDSTIKTFDASAATGAINVTLTPGSTLTSAKGGTGTGDILQVNSLSATNVVTGFESVWGNASATYDMSATDATTFGTRAATGIATVTKASALQNTVNIYGVGISTADMTKGGLTYSLATATGTADAVTVNMNNFGVVTTKKLTTGVLTFNGIENLTLNTAADIKTTTLGNLTLAGVSATAAASITVNGTTVLNVGTLTNSAASTAVSTVNFGGMTGKTTMIYSGVDSVTVTGGSAKDTYTNGVVGAGEVGTFNLGDDNDVMNLIAINGTGTLAVNGEAGDDTFNVGVALTLGTAITIDGGAGTADEIINTGVSQVNVTQIDNVEKIQAQATGAIFDGAALSGDTIVVTSFAAGAGRMQVQAGTGGVVVDLSKITFSGPNSGLIILGGAGGDTITGTASADSIDTSAGGTNTITGGVGVDTITVDVTAADTIAGFAGKAAGDVLTVTVTDIESLAGVGDLVAGAATTSIAGATAADIFEYAGAAVTLGATDNIVVLTASTYANNAAVLTEIGTTNVVSWQANPTTLDAILVLYSDGTDVHLISVQDAGTDATMTAADLTATTLVNLSGITSIAAGDFVAANFDFL